MILSLQDPNCATDEIINKINQCIESATTVIKQKRNNRNMTPRRKWITSAIMVSCKKKEFLYNIWRKNKESDVLKKEYMDVEVW